MDLGRLIRFIKERETTVEDVKRYVAGLRGSADADTVTIAHGALGERQRVLLSIAERAGAVELEPAGRDGLLVRLTGQGSPRKAYAAIKAAKDRGWEAYRSIERFSTGAETCRRRQILDHFGDAELGQPTGRCCDVCDPDPELELAASAAPKSSGRRREGRGGSQGSPAAEALEPALAKAFERLRLWRKDRAEGKPAFTVAADSVLAEVLRRRPRGTAELIEIKGIGPAFCEKHGESLLTELADLEAQLEGEGVPRLSA
jgi:ATP-dependent DNA helicase RecQ